MADATDTRKWQPIETAPEKVEVWTEINGAGSWEANPWVTAISFTVHHCNIDEMGEAV